MIAARLAYLISWRRDTITGQKKNEDKAEASFSTAEHVGTETTTRHEKDTTLLSVPRSGELSRTATFRTAGPTYSGK